jgi:GT2 family glycosyltransferase
MYNGACNPNEPPARRISAARNYGARGAHHATLVFNDADSLCKPEQVRWMVRLAEQAPGLVFGFTVYSRLADVPITHWPDAFTAPVEWQMFHSLSSGCIAIRRECFEEVGGYDETWQYGFEDYDFAQRCAKLWPLRRVEGELYHLYHPRPAVEPENGPDAARYAEMYG